MEVSERRLPNSAGSFFGVIGCYYFGDIQAVMDVCLERTFKRFSEYFNHLPSRRTPAQGIRLETAEFFGDKEQIRLLEIGTAKFRGTIFCDIDGTLIVHEDTPNLFSRLPLIAAREAGRNCATGLPTVPASRALRRATESTTRPGSRKCCASWIFPIIRS